MSSRSRFCVPNAASDTDCSPARLSPCRAATHPNEHDTSRLSRHRQNCRLIGREFGAFAYHFFGGLGRGLWLEWLVRCGRGLARGRRGWPAGGRAGWAEAAGRGLLSPTRLGGATGLQERVRDHGHERRSMKPCPGAALEVVEPELFLELLVRRLATPSGLDGGRKLSEPGVGRRGGRGARLAERSAPAAARLRQNAAEAHARSPARGRSPQGRSRAGCAAPGSPLGREPASAFRLAVPCQDRILAADQPVGLSPPRRLQRPRIPDPGRHQGVPPAVAHLARSHRQGLHALALPRTDRTRHIDRAPAPTRRMRPRRQKRPQPALQVPSPGSVPSHRR
jgi:hypothetical protein